MVKFFHRASAKIGLPPGTPIYVGTTPPEKTEITFVQYDNEKNPIKSPLQIENIGEQIQKLPAAGGWINVSGFQDTHVIQNICEALDIHPLLIEDILNTEQLSKIEFFNNYTLIITREPRMASHSDIVKLEQISIILKGNLIVTFQKRNGSLVNQITHYLSHFILKPMTLDCGHILYLLLDMIIDEHMAIVEKKGEELEKIEEVIIAEDEEIQAKTLYLLKRDMLHLRKNIMGLRNIVDLLIHEHSNVISNVPIIYLHDLRDHLLRILDFIEMHRELSKNILDIYMSTLNTKINETMKFLAVFASIFIPLSFIASFYGMNFPTFPIMQFKHAYLIVVGMMLTVAISLLLYFRKKKWI